MMRRFLSLLLVEILLGLPLVGQTRLTGRQTVAGRTTISQVADAGAPPVGAGTIEVLVISELAGTSTDEQKKDTAPAIFKRINNEVSSVLNNPAVYTDVAVGSSHIARVENLPAFSYPYGTCTGAGCMPASFPSTPTCTFGATGGGVGECSTAANISVSDGVITRVVFKADGISNYQGNGTNSGATIGGRDEAPIAVTNESCSGAGSLQEAFNTARDGGGGWIYLDPDTFGIGGDWEITCTSLHTNEGLWISGSNITVDLSSVRTRMIRDTQLRIDPRIAGTSTCVDTHENGIVRNVNLWSTNTALGMNVMLVTRGSSATRCPDMLEDPRHWIITHNTLTRQYPSGDIEDTLTFDSALAAAGGEPLRNYTFANNLLNRNSSGTGINMQGQVFNNQFFHNVVTKFVGRVPEVVTVGTESGGTPSPEFQTDWTQNVVGMGINTAGSAFYALIFRNAWAQLHENWYVGLDELNGAASRRALDSHCINLNTGLDSESFSSCNAFTAKTGVADGNVFSNDMMWSRYNVNFPKVYLEDWSISGSAGVRTANLAAITPYNANNWENAKAILQRAGSRPLTAEAVADVDELWAEVVASQPITTVDDDAEVDFSQWNTQGHLSISTDTAVSGTKSFKSSTSGGDAILVQGQTAINNFFNTRIRRTGTCPASDTPIAIFKDASDAEVFRLEFNATDCRIYLDRSGTETLLGSAMAIDTWYHLRAMFRQRFTSGTCDTTFSVVDGDCNKLAAAMRDGGTARANKQLLYQNFGGSGPVIKSITIPQAPASFTFYLDDVGVSPVHFCDQMGCAE